MQLPWGHGTEGRKPGKPDQSSVVLPQRASRSAQVHYLLYLVLPLGVGRGDKNTANMSCPDIRRTEWEGTIEIMHFNSLDS